jgi:hypothetical protein
MPIHWNLRDTLRRQGIENAFQLAERAAIGYPAAVRIFAHMDADDALGRFDLRTLEKLAVALNVKRPFSLLRYEPG